MVHWDQMAEIGSHARETYEEVEAAGPAARPLEFPAPTVHRGVRITVNGCDHRTGKFHRVKNVLVRTGRDHTGGIPHVHDLGYCIRRKLCDSEYGSVRLCVVMKRRLSFLHEGKPPKSPSGSLESISEEDDWIQSSRECPSEEGVVWESTDELAVVKVVSWARVQYKRGKHLEDPVKEIAAMQYLGNYNRYVIGSLEVLQDDEHLYSITPYCDGGDLYTWTMDEFAKNGTGRLTESQARRWFRQILKGLYHLQKKGVCHRDLSLENVMVHEDQCKIIDFGMCLRVPYSDPFNEGCVADVSAGTVRRLIQAQGQGGRWTYMAPEVVAREEEFDGFAIDLWAAGVILYIMLVGLAPFKWAHESDQRFERFANGKLRETLRYWDIPISDEACDLLQNMFWRDPRQRLTLAEILEHPWMARKRGKVETSPEKDVSACTNKKLPARNVAECSKKGTEKDIDVHADWSPEKDFAVCTKRSPEKDAAGCTKESPEKDAAGRYKKSPGKGAAKFTKKSPEKDHEKDAPACPRRGHKLHLLRGMMKESRQGGAEF